MLLPPGTALSTAHGWSRSGRAARSGGPGAGHLIDPRTGRAPALPWRTASVTATSALGAAGLATAALIRGVSAPAWLAHLWVPSRLVGSTGEVTTTGPWLVHEAPVSHSTSYPTNPLLAVPAQRSAAS